MSALKPIEFKESNKVLTKPQNMDEECGDLHVFNDGKQSISCWRLSFKQRISALLFGRIWLSVFGGITQPPVWIDCSKTVFIDKEE
jgi:hypothetical protein